MIMSTCSKNNCNDCKATTILKSIPKTELRLVLDIWCWQSNHGIFFHLSTWQYFALCVDYTGVYLSMFKHDVNTAYAL